MKNKPHHLTDEKIQSCLQSIHSVILGKSKAVKIALAALFARGSVLIEDHPGLGKTTLAKTLARVLGLSFQRIQCTNDLLPMDILGRVDFSLANQPRLIAGPIFASIVLLDELNRAPARTQSAFLQAMEEGEVSLEGITHALPQPQMFIATQNPYDQISTNLLPASELDRFTVQISLGYPEPIEEKKILRRVPQEAFKNLTEVLNKNALLEIQNQVEHVNVSDSFLDLVVRFLNHIRSKGAFLSPRAGQDFIRVSQAIALMQKRDFVTPEDFQFCLDSVANHRVKDINGFIQSFDFQA
jgi:MoxR-like ATPase